MQTPVPVIPLDYDDRTADPWRPVARLVAAVVIVQGATMAVSSGWSALRIVTQSGGGIPASAVDRFGLAVEVAKAATAGGLVAAGRFAWRRRASGRQWCVALQPVLAGLVLAEAAQWAWQLSGATGPDWLLWTVDDGLSAVTALVLPAFVWAFFRRPDVRASFGL